MKKAALLSKAADLITGHREGDYGDIHKNFSDIARLWSPVLGMQITTHQVALCLMLLKVARIIKTPTHIDSWADAAGYLGIGCELATGGDGE